MRGDSDSRSCIWHDSDETDDLDQDHHKVGGFIVGQIWLE